LVKRLVYLLVILLVSKGCVMAGNLEKGFEALKIYNYFEAKKLFEKSIKKHPAGAYFGLGTIFASAKNPFHNLDSAYNVLKLCESNFRLSENKEVVYLLGFGVDSIAIEMLRKDIEQQAFLQARKINSIDGFSGYLITYPQAKWLKQARIARDSLAFEVAMDKGTYEAYRDYMINYSGSEWAGDARKLYERSLYETLTKENSEKGYVDFISDFPGSLYRAVAEDSVFSIVTRKGTIESFRNFVLKYPKYHNVEEAWKMLYVLSTANRSKEAYAEFLLEFPNYPNIAQVQLDMELARMEFYKIRHGEKWGFISENGEYLVDPTFDFVEKI